MTNHFIAGIDYSLSSPAVCIINKQFNHKTCRIYNLTNSKKLCKDYFLKDIVLRIEPMPFYENNLERFSVISEWLVNKVINTYNIKDVYIEGFSMNSSVGRITDLAEATGVLKYRLYKSGLNVIPIPPTKIKKIASGKGNANKKFMEETFIKETNINVREIIGLKTKDDSPVSDIIDSYYVAKTGIELNKSKVARRVFCKK
jgi:Holliday junction resolvasome RuvABC endonuclease subunit